MEKGERDDEDDERHHRCEGVGCREPPCHTAWVDPCQEAYVCTVQ
jgi:hypothetical protein